MSWPGAPVRISSSRHSVRVSRTGSVARAAGARHRLPDHRVGRQVDVGTGRCVTAMAGRTASSRRSAARSRASSSSMGTAW